MKAKRLARVARVFEALEQRANARASHAQRSVQELSTFVDSFERGGRSVGPGWSEELSSTVSRRQKGLDGQRNSFETDAAQNRRMRMKFERAAERAAAGENHSQDRIASDISTELWSQNKGRKL